MNEDCGCCEGIGTGNPPVVANRPGMDALAYRVGTHASFLDRMKARLSSHALITDELPDGNEGEKIAPRLPLLSLTTRSGDDAAIAMLDAWATVADVLTFYQERIANEGYLRTATERRSVLELARLLGYELHHGVASSVYLAFTLDAGTEQEIPAGTRAQSVPEPGELPQSYETSEPLPARADWNVLGPRMTRPQHVLNQLMNEGVAPYLWLAGTATNLTVGDPLLVVAENQRVIYRILEVVADTAADRTFVRMELWTQQPVIRAQRVAALSTSSVSTLKDTVNNALDLGGTNVSSNTKTVQTTVSILSKLKLLLDEKSAGEVLQTLEEEILPQLRELLDRPAVQRSANLRAWLGGIVEELEDVAGSLTTVEPAGEVDLEELFDEPGLFDVPSSVTRSQQPGAQRDPLALIGQISEKLLLPASAQPSSPQYLDRSIEYHFQATSDLAPRLLVAFNEGLGDSIYSALGNAPVTKEETVKVYAMRVLTSLFGSSAPQKIRLEPDVSGSPGTAATDRPLIQRFDEWDVDPQEDNNLLFLDNAFEKILPASYVAVLRPDKESPTVFTGTDVATRSRHAYGIAGKTTRITLSGEWWRPRLSTVNNTNVEPDPPQFQMDMIRGTRVFAQSELLPLAEEPIVEDICNDRIILDGVYDGLKEGRWLIIKGERAGIDLPAADAPTIDEQFDSIRNGNAETPVTPPPGPAVTPATGPGTNAPAGADGEVEAAPIPGIEAIELVMLKGVEIGYDPDLPGDRMRTSIVLANGLAYCYKRATVTIYGNVVKATHGETREEVLGSGDGSRPMQAFTLRQSPLTYVSAATVSGVESTLQVRVNDCRWHETDTLAGLSPTDHNFITRTDDEDKTTVIFGNGERGARLPTGVENVKALYRTGIGRPGNTKAGKITLLATKPLNVKTVTNPIPATGGADRENLNEARQNAPLGVLALDRLVSTQDHEDFARTFTGIGKVSAARLTDGQRQLVHLTIAGADDIPIAPESDLFNNLRLALLKFGDPYQAIQINVRQLKLLVISAGVSLHPDYLLETVEPKIRQALLDYFSFNRRALGQDVYLSEVISVIQSVPGVLFVDVDTLDALDEDLSSAGLELIGKRKKPRQRIPVRMARVDRYALELRDRIKPAQLALLSPAVPETLILKEWKA